MLPGHPQPAVRRHNPVPTCWLMLDARLGNAMLGAVRALPPRSAVIVRPQAMTPAQRSAAALRAVRAIARARRHLLLHSGHQPPGFDGVHGSGGRLRGPAAFRTMPVHDARQGAAARRLRADAILVSPVHATASHPDGKTIGLCGFRRLSAGSGIAAIALGGMDAARFVMARRHGATGWAAISGWVQKRNWVPT